jgi:hypothetical protein
MDEREPVCMTGYRTANGGYIGHAWVCDGMKQESGTTSFFVEFISPYNYSYYSSDWTLSNPGAAYISDSTNRYFHMNWGWGGSNDNWFFDNTILLPNGYNYNVNRYNFYVKP